MEGSWVQAHTPTAFHNNGVILSLDAMATIEKKEDYQVNVSLLTNEAQGTARKQVDERGKGITLSGIRSPSHMVKALVDEEHRLPNR